MPIEISVPPPDRTSFLKECEMPQQWFELELLKEFNFVLDVESDAFMPPKAADYSFQRKPWPFTQCVHRSGVAFVQIQSAHKLLWVDNRLTLANNNYKSINSPLINPVTIRNQLIDFCRDAQKLQHFWDSKAELLQKLVP